MAKIYRTAMGRQIDIDDLMLRNETVIAVGNRKVNARGDELGPGGKVVKTRDQIMKEYYALNTPVAVDPIPVHQQKAPISRPASPIPDVVGPISINPASGLEIDDLESVETITSTSENKSNVRSVRRGPLANSVAAETTVIPPNPTVS